MPGIDTYMILYLNLIIDVEDRGNLDGDVSGCQKAFRSSGLVAW